MLLADDHPRMPACRRVGEEGAALPRRHDVGADVAQRHEASVPLERREAAEAPARDVLQEDTLDGVLGAEREDLLQRRCHCVHGGHRSHASNQAGRVRVAGMPIHVRAESGDYADAVLLPGDPLRAKYIAETYLADVQQRNEERGLLGYTGTYNGKTVSVQGTGMGCPGATIVFE